MTAKGKIFSRLPARRWGAIRRASLWDTKDYLLSVSGTLFSERYRRYYYRDIQAIVVQNGPRLGSIGALVLVSWLTITLLYTATIPGMISVVEFIWLVPTTWLVFVGYVSVAGSCRVFIYTAVSREELPALFRRRAVARVLPRILAKIRAAQGEFDPAYESAAVDASSLETLATQPGEEVDPLLPPVGAIGSASGYFVLILGSAAFAYWYSNELLTPQSLTGAKLIFCVLNFAEVASGIWGLMKVARFRLFNSVRALIIAGMILLALRTYALMILLLGLSVRNGMLAEGMDIVRTRFGLGLEMGS